MDSMSSAAHGKRDTSSHSQALLSKLLEHVSSLNLATEDFPWFPRPKKRKIGVSVKVSHL